MRRLLAPALALSLAACASTGTNTAASGAPVTGNTTTNTATTMTIPNTDTRLDIAVSGTNFTSATSIGKGVDAVWVALPDIWKSLGLEAETMSTKDHRMVTGLVRVRRQLGGVNLSRYVECGRSTLGPNADSYFITLKFETVLTGDAKATVVQSGMQVSGEPVGNGGATARCSSTGELENRVGERLQKRLTM
jgi:hypothetical protein